MWSGMPKAAAILWGAQRLLKSSSFAGNRMKNKVKRKEFPCILNSQFISGSPLVQSDCSIYWSAGNLLWSLLFFLFMLGDAQMRKMLKKNGILGLAVIGVKWKY